MIDRRTAMGILGAIAGATLAGCSKLPGQSDSKPEPSPAEQLRAAAKKLAEATVIVSTSVGARRITSKLDPPGRRGTYGFESQKDGKRHQVGILMIEGDLWITDVVDGVIPTKSTYVSRARAEAAGIPDFMPADDPTGALALVNAMSDLRREGDFRGVVDLTKANPPGAVIPSGTAAQVKALPVTAKVDADGRLTSISIDTSSAGGGDAEIVYAGFGRRLHELVRPADDKIVVATDEFVKSLAAGTWR